MKKYIILLCSGIIAAMFLTSCQPYQAQPQLSPLEIETMQTESFNVPKRTAFNATVTVFQNLGYIIQTANFDTGFITASSPQTTDFFGNTSYTKTTAFITSNNENSAIIRINFVESTSYYNKNSGNIVNDEPILSPQSYTNAFAKIQQQIFVMTGMNPVVTPVSAN